MAGAVESLCAVEASWAICDVRGGRSTGGRAPRRLKYPLGCITAALGMNMVLGAD